MFMQSEDPKSTFVVDQYRCLNCGHVQQLLSRIESSQRGYVILKELREAWWVEAGFSSYEEAISKNY
jgi:hypothetical protein